MKGAFGKVAILTTSIHTLDRGKRRVKSLKHSSFVPTYTPPHPPLHSSAGLIRDFMRHFSEQQRFVTSYASSKHVCIHSTPFNSRVTTLT